MVFEAGVEGDEADEAIAKFAEASDEMFAEIVLYAKNGFPRAFCVEMNCLA